MYINIEIYRGDDNIYITRCPELNLYANGKTQKEAIANIKRIIAKFIDKSNSSINAKQDIDFTAHYYSARSPQMH